MALCGQGNDIFDHLACSFNVIGVLIGSKVCEFLYLYETGLADDEVHIRKRREYCSTTFEKTWELCRNYTSPIYFGQPALKWCLREASAKLLELKEAMDLYGR